MIEFDGKLTGECKKFLVKKEICLNLLVSSITFILFSIPVILLSIYWSRLTLLFLIPLFIMLMGSLLPLSEKEQKSFIPQKIFLDLSENTIVHQCEETERFHMIDSVKKVIDYGEWYHVLFYYEDRDLYFVCQKSLLTKGTLEEFEALFEGKIERRV